MDGWMDRRMDGWMYGCIYIYIYIWVSNGYRWRRYDNLIRSKHVTVYAKVQVMQQRYMPSRCHQVPRLPRETKVDVSKCHACHANSRGVPAPHLKPSAPPEPAQCHKRHACHARVEVDVTKYHTCHVKRRCMFPSATPTAAASRRHT